MSRSSSGQRRDTDVPLDEQLALLRPGDVVTYCYSGTPRTSSSTGPRASAFGPGCPRPRHPLRRRPRHGLVRLPDRGGRPRRRLPAGHDLHRPVPRAMSARSPSTTCHGPSRSSSRPACRRSTRSPRPPGGRRQPWAWRPRPARSCPALRRPLRSALERRRGAARRHRGWHAAGRLLGAGLRREGRRDRRRVVGASALTAP